MADKKEPVKIDPELNRLLKSIGEKAKLRDSSIAEDAKKAAAEVHKEIGKPRGEQAWLPFAPMPTDLCRVSPFFPMAQKQMKDRPYLRDIVITESSWGKITYTGPKLSTFEEDSLVAVLALIDIGKNVDETTDEEGRKTYTYQGPLLPVMKLMGLKSFSKPAYNRTIRALKFLVPTAISLETKKGLSDTVNMLSRATWNEKTKELTVTLNPFFAETYMSGRVTLIDVLKRASITSPVAKNLYRFMQSHREPKWSGHFLTLAAALNLDLEQPAYQIRRQIKTAITALQKTSVGVLSKSSKLDGDIVKLTMTQTAQKSKGGTKAIKGK